MVGEVDIPVNSVTFFENNDRSAGLIKRFGTVLRRGLHDGVRNATTVRGMISNEKYTGDVIFQKTYTDSQFNRHVNYGQRDQYAMADHHEAIISHEVFETANALVEQRGKEKGIVKGSEKYQSRYRFCTALYQRRLNAGRNVR